jgi:hypothetical protein
MAAITMTVFWVVALCSPVQVYRRLLPPSSGRSHGATTQNTAIFKGILIRIECSRHWLFVHVD